IYSFAANHLQPELFEAKTLSGIPNDVLAGIIEDLYTPRHLPSVGAVYDFSWIDADVLGRAYEKYLSQVLQSNQRPSQLELLQSIQPSQEIDQIKNKKAAGIYYTPSFLVSFLVKEAIDRYFASGGTEEPRIVDPSCGSGS